MTKKELEVIWKIIQKDIKGTKFEGQVYFVGGCVRGFIMDTEFNDVDIAVTMPNGGIEFARWYTKKYNADSNFNPVVYGRANTAKFIIESKPEFKGVKFEAVQTMLNPLYTLKDKVGLSENLGTIADDAMLRDLTINAIYIDISDGVLLDPLCGMDDITNKILTTTGNPDAIFTDDPLRMLRVIRFASKFGWNIDKRTWFGIIKNNDKIESVANERIREEFNAILMTDKPSVGLDRLLTSGLLYYMMPTMYGMTRVGRDVRAIAPSQWKHTLEVVDGTQPILLNRICAFFHDIGKCSTFKIQNGKAQYVGHDGSGSVFAENIMKKYCYPTNIVNKVKTIIKSHMAFAGVVHPYTPKPKTIRKFLSECGDDVDTALDVMRANYAAHSYNKLLHFELISEKISEVAEDLLKREKKDFKIPVNGNEIMEACHVKSGPLIQEIINEIRDKMYENPDISKEEAINIAKNYMAVLAM